MPPHLRDGANHKPPHDTHRYLGHQPLDAKRERDATAASASAAGGIVVQKSGVPTCGTDRHIPLQTITHLWRRGRASTARDMLHTVTYHYTCGGGGVPQPREMRSSRADCADPHTEGALSVETRRRAPTAPRAGAYEIACHPRYVTLCKGV